MKLRQAYKHCPRCGQVVGTQDGHSECPNCGLKIYFNPIPSASVILRNKAGEVMLAERKFDPGKGLWTLPGGFTEPGEDFEQNARREVREELGLEIGSLSYVGTFTVDYIFQNLNYANTVVCFAADLPSTNIKPADDVARIEFFRPSKIPLDKLAFPNMRAMFEKL